MRSTEDENMDRRLIVSIPKSEPPLEDSFVFPADNGGLRRRVGKPEKEAKGAVPKNRRPSYTII